MRTELAYRFRISPSDYLGLLRCLENEGIGALVFRSTDTETTGSPEPSYHLVDNKTLLQLAAFPISTAADLAEEGRFSLTGAQAKIGIYLENEHVTAPKNAGYPSLEACYLPEGSAPSTHILKISDPRLTGLPTNETFCLSAAKACGLDVCESFICMIGESKAYITKRYDRKMEYEPALIDGMARPLRLHQEDFCQALGLPGYFKYERQETDNYVAIIASLLERASSNVIEDKKMFTRQIVFDYLVGNCDNHLKNYSLLSSTDWSMRRLAPAYDVVCTTILGYSREMGLSVGDARNIDTISPADWAFFAQDLRIPKKVLVELMADIVTRFTKICSSETFRPADEEDGAVIKSILADANPRLKRLQDTMTHRALLSR